MRKDILFVGCVVVAVGFVVSMLAMLIQTTSAPPVRASSGGSGEHRRPAQEKLTQIGRP